MAGRLLKTSPFFGAMFLRFPLVVVVAVVQLPSCFVLLGATNKSRERSPGRLEELFHDHRLEKPSTGVVGVTGRRSRVSRRWGLARPRPKTDWGSNRVFGPGQW